MTHSIVAGKVIIGRTTKPADFESKKAEVELSFAIAEGSTHDQAFEAVTAVANSAIAKVHEILGLTPPATGSTGKPPKGAKSKTTETNGVTTTTAGPAEAAAKTQAAADVTLEDGPAKLPDDALGLGEDDGGLGDMLGLTDAAPQPVTDQALIDAITKKNGEIKDPQAIRGLIGKYVTPPKQAKDIPAETRHKFLEELAALTGKA